MVDRPAAERIKSVSGNHEAFLFVKSDRARIVGIDVKAKSARRQKFGFCDERAGNAFAPIFRRHHNLVEIARGGLDGDETDYFIFIFGHDDSRGLRQAMPMSAPPV